jgi:hypothetical protein
MGLIKGMDEKTVSFGEGRMVSARYVALEVHDPVMRESLPISLSNDAAEALANSLLEIVRKNRRDQ